METFTAGMKTYLAQKGKLCLGKTEWPVSVAPQQEQARSRDAVQMPVLQKLGLVSVTEAMVQYKDESKSELIKVKQYSLTNEGRQWYTDKPPSSVTSDGARVQHHGDLCVATLTLDRPRALTVMLATLCHDLGKPSTTLFEEGRLRSRGHEEAGLSPTESLLDRWNVHSLLGYDVRGQVLALVANHLKPGQLYDDRERVSDGAIRRLAAKCEPGLLYRVARADCLGRTGDFPPVAMEWFLARVRQLDVAERPPAPLLKGRDVVALGVAPGPEVGRVVREVYERQLDGAITTVDQARAEAAKLVALSRGGSGS